MRNLNTDLSNGVKLIQLMEIMGDTSLGRYYQNPKMRVQMAENVNKALDFIRGRGVVLTNVGAEGEYAPPPFSPLTPLCSPTIATPLISSVLINPFAPPLRCHRWEPQTHPWYDLDSHPPLHHRRHQ